MAEEGTDQNSGKRTFSGWIIAALVGIAGIIAIGSVMGTPADALAEMVGRYIGFTVLGAAVRALVFKGASPKTNPWVLALLFLVLAICVILGNHPRH